MLKRIEKMPVPVLAVMVGAATLSNVYAGLNYTWIRHLTMWAATLVLLAYTAKIICYPAVCRREYSNVVPASLYAGFTMILMILGSYYFDYMPTLGKGMWYVGLAVHAVHILVFTYRNVIAGRNVNTFVPSWFVTYNGIMVSCVVGGAMQAGHILKYVVYYGILVYILIIPMMIYRLLNVEVKKEVYHTMAVVLAPCSLCVVSYLNVIREPNFLVVSLLYGCVLLSLLFVIIKLPKFFSFRFTPGFAGMTFPMAIGIVATNKMSGYLKGVGYEGLSSVLSQLGGIQIYLTSMIIGFVLLNLLMMLFRVQRQEN